MFRFNARFNYHVGVNVMQGMGAVGGGGGGAAGGGGEDDEADPLDAFMTGLQAPSVTQARTQNHEQEQATREKIAISTMGGVPQPTNLPSLLYCIGCWGLLVSCLRVHVLCLD